MEFFRKIYILIFVGIFITSCDDNIVSSDGGSSSPAKFEIESPTGDSVYWTDIGVPCEADVGIGNSTPVSWQVDGQSVSCENGSLDFRFEEGTYTVTASVSRDGEAASKSVTVEVMEGFTVSIVSPEGDDFFFTGDEVPCEAEVSPAKYEDDLVWTVAGREVDCNSDISSLKVGIHTLSAEVSAFGRTEGDEVELEILPVISGKVLGFTDDALLNPLPEVIFTSNSSTGIELSIMVKGKTSSAEVTPEGNFSLKDELAREIKGNTQIELFVSGNGDFYSSYVNLEARELLELMEEGRLKFLLSPKRWRIPTGKHKGKTTDIRLIDAFESDSFDGVDFFDPNLKSILKQDRPLKVALAQSKSDKRFSKKDSLSFWEKMELLEDYLGMGKLFTPAKESEVPTTQDGVHVWVDESDDRSRAGPATDNGNIIGGFIHFSRVSKVNSNFTVMHEAGHVFGFGHMGRWDSIMGGWNRPTPLDVSHFQLAYTVRQLQHDEGIPFGVEESYAALKR